MFHLVARATVGRLLFRTHAEASALFCRLATAFPDSEAASLMPDHVHIVVREEDRGRLTILMGAYARWRNAHRGEAGPVWVAHPPPQPIPDQKHLRRTIRYVHLNPCRDGLVDDPLSWAWSTHRDAVGFAAAPIRPPEREPERFHRWVSGDPSTRVEGTDLYQGTSGRVSWAEVALAVSAICRVPLSALRRRGLARSLAVRTALLHDLNDIGEIADQVGMTRAGIYLQAKKVPPRLHLHREPALRACFQAVGDPRIEELHEGDLRRDPRWGRYRSWR